MTYKKRDKLNKTRRYVIGRNKTWTKRDYILEDRGGTPVRRAQGKYSQTPMFATKNALSNILRFVSQLIYNCSTVAPRFVILFTVIQKCMVIDLIS